MGGRRRNARDYPNGTSMAQGCILPVTTRDSQELRRSLQDPNTQRAILAAGEAIDNRDKYAYCDAITYPLANPGDAAHEVFVDYVLRNVEGNEVIDESYAQALPKAVVAIARQTKDILGLVTPSLGKRASANDKTLKHRTRGDAFAYELLGTAELIRLNEARQTGSRAANGGPELRVFESDRLDLGVRFNTGNRRNGEEAGLFRPTSKQITMQSETFEADLLIRRNVESGLAQKVYTIGVDFKHSRTATSYSTNSQDFARKINDVVQGIVRGELGLAEYHYVTNGYFDAPFKEAVAKANETIMAHQQKHGETASPKIALHERLQFPLT
jgi:hypothetical protein